jgi:hypothetical protein
LLSGSIRDNLAGPVGGDWIGYPLIANFGDPYTDHTWYRWSPVMSWLLIPFTALGLGVWLLLKGAAVLLVKPRWVVGVVLLSPPIWSDVRAGSVMTFIFVAGWTALQGHRAGTIATYVLAMLMPRPLVIPLLIYLAWKQPWSRWWLAGIIVAHALLVLASGYGPGFVERLIASGPEEMAHFAVNFSPLRELGWIWLPIGGVLIGLCLRFGLVGVACLLASPYYIAYYGVVLLWDLRLALGADLPRHSVEHPHEVDDRLLANGVGVRAVQDSDLGNCGSIGGGAHEGPGDPVARPVVVVDI